MRSKKQNSLLALIVLAVGSLLMATLGFVSYTFADPAFESLQSIAGRVTSITILRGIRAPDEYRFSLEESPQAYSLQRCARTSVEQVLRQGDEVQLWVEDNESDVKTVWQMSIDERKVCSYQDAVAWSDTNRLAALVLGIAFSGFFLYAAWQIRTGWLR